MTRKLSALIFLVAIIIMIFADLRFSQPLNPYAALPPFALGSGQGSSGAICTAGGR